MIDWTPNPGYLPTGAAGKRVRVILERDREAMAEPVYEDQFNKMAPPGWASDGKNACRWSISGHPFDIAFYAVIR